MICRYGTLGRVRKPSLLRSDNSLVFGQVYTRLDKELRAEVGVHHTVLPTAEQNGEVDNWTLKAQYVYEYHFESAAHQSSNW